jgi:hypothetical protein
VILVDICVFRKARKPSFRVVLARESGFTEYYFLGFIEHILLDHVAIQRLRMMPHYQMICSL